MTRIHAGIQLLKSRPGPERLFATTKQSRTTNGARHYGGPCRGATAYIWRECRSRRPNMGHSRDLKLAPSAAEIPGVFLRDQPTPVLAFSDRRLDLLTPSEPSPSRIKISCGVQWLFK